MKKKKEKMKKKKNDYVYEYSPKTKGLTYKGKEKQ